jgi:septum formation protein
MTDKLNLDHRPLLILASGSPRRAELLAAAGIHFTIRAANVDETRLSNEPPAVYVERLARDKALAVAALMADERDDPALILGADTTVVIGDEVAGKPIDIADAERMLGLLSGAWHEVLTGVAMVRGSEVRSEVVVTRVKFATLSDAELRWYAASGEPDDKAGAYAIQGLASLYDEKVEGNYANVVGLPVPIVYRMAKELGIDLLAV